LDVWLNGVRVETESSFDESEEGTSMQFPLDSTSGATKACIRTVSSGNKREGIVHSLIIDDQEIPESLE